MIRLSGDDCAYTKLFNWILESLLHIVHNLCILAELLPSHQEVLAAERHDLYFIFRLLWSLTGRDDKEDSVLRHSNTKTSCLKISLRHCWKWNSLIQMSQFMFIPLSFPQTLCFHKQCLFLKPLFLRHFEDSI